MTTLGHTAGVYVKFAVTNESNASFAASPFIESNDSPEVDLALAVLRGLR